MTTILEESLLFLSQPIKWQRMLHCNALFTITSVLIYNIPGMVSTQPNTFSITEIKCSFIFHINS